jgi:LmbE family N-acetylglucosaminyl deacetylase
MVVMAHADDAEWTCAATMAKMCAEGWEVVLVLCTDGSKGSDDPEMTAERLAEIRAGEQRESGRILGLKDVVFLGYPDSYLEPTLQLRKDIAREIRRHRPHVVITEPPTRDIDSRYYGSHPDHLATGEAAVAAVFPTARDRLTFPELLEEGLEPHKVREVWIVGGLVGSDHFIDVDGYIETAVEALKAHRSQVSAEAAEKYFPIGRAETAAKVGLKYAEAFKTIKYH